MSGMMKTEEPTFTTLEFNNLSTPADLGETKKVKLMYTSEFLKSFDKAPKTGSFLPVDELEVDGSKKVRSKELDKLRERLDFKDTQIQQLKDIIFSLKQLILEKHDDATLKRFNDILSENEEGRQILHPDILTKSFSKERVAIPPLNLKLSESDSFLDIPGGLSSGALSPNSQISPSTKQLSRSPRRKERGMQEPMLSPTSVPLLSPSAVSTPSIPSISNPPAQPASALTPTTPTGKTVSLKSPRRNNTKTTTVVSPPPIVSPVTTTTTTTTSSNNISKNAMKRSPSMPVINNERQKQDTQAQLKLQKKTKSTEDASDKTRKAFDDSTKKAKGAEATSPRKGIKKSVSMSSISSEDKAGDVSLANLKCTSLEEIVGQIYPLTKYQAGCRFLQKKLEEQPDPQHVTLVFNEVFEHLIELMTDPYGQYLVPKLMKYCDKNQRQAIVTKIAPKIVTFACHTYGIHGVQKILEYLTDDQVTAFIDVIRPSVILLAKDPKGNYLIQSFLKQFPSERNQFIYDAINENCVEVATHKVGCTLINRCIDYANEPQLNQLVGNVTGNCLQLVQDQFGNYVVQHLLATKVQFAPLIIKSLLGHIPELSVQKFSSNVIEKCLQVASAEQYSDVIKEITDSNLLELLQDRYANFVIQTALDVADDQQHAKLVKLILPFIHQIKTPYVMHIQKKILQV